MDNIINRIENSANYIKSMIKQTPEIGIVLGSGLGPLANEIENPIVIKYSDITDFPVSTVAGHSGELVIGYLQGKYVCAMSGRFHYYEGYDMDVVTMPIRVFSKLGIKNLILTNAAGGIGDNLDAGDIMLIKDHISILCPSVLRGANLLEFGPRFPDMTEVYTKSLQALAMQCAKDSDICLKEGNYIFFSGPRYETPADVLALKTLGASATGMSTVPEAIVARHCGMNILGISLITNKGAGLSKSPLEHKEVVEIAKKAEKRFCLLVKNIVKEWNL